MNTVTRRASTLVPTLDAASTSHHPPPVQASRVRRHGAKGRVGSAAARVGPAGRGDRARRLAEVGPPPCRDHGPAGRTCRPGRSHRGLRRPGPSHPDGTGLHRAYTGLPTTRQGVDRSLRRRTTLPRDEATTGKQAGTTAPTRGTDSSVGPAGEHRVAHGQGDRASRPRFPSSPHQPIALRHPSRTRMDARLYDPGNDVVGVGGSVETAQRLGGIADDLVVSPRLIVQILKNQHPFDGISAQDPRHDGRVDPDHEPQHSHLTRVPDNSARHNRDRGLLPNLRTRRGNPAQPAASPRTARAGLRDRWSRPCGHRRCGGRCATVRPCASPTAWPYQGRVIRRWRCLASWTVQASASSPTRRYETASCSYARVRSRRRRV